MGLVIVSLAAIAVALVHIRRAEITTRHEIQRLQMRQVTLRRALWDQQIRLGLLTSPEEVRRRAEEMKLEVVPKDDGAATTSTPEPRHSRPAR